MVKETPLTPGKVIDNANIAGEGCYLDDEGTLRSALFGHLIISDDPNDSNDSIANVIPFDSNIYNNNDNDNNNNINDMDIDFLQNQNQNQIKKKRKRKNVVVKVDDSAICRVLKITMNYAIVEILYIINNSSTNVKDVFNINNQVNDDIGTELLQYPKGVIRKEDIHLSDVTIDKLIISDCYLPGDIIRATVISLGDAKQYYLSTTKIEDGCMHALSRKTGNQMHIINNKEMQDPISKIIEKRKCCQINDSDYIDVEFRKKNEETLRKEMQRFLSSWRFGHA